MLQAELQAAEVLLGLGADAESFKLAGRSGTFAWGIRQKEIRPLQKRLLGNFKSKRPGTVTNICITF